MKFELFSKLYQEAAEYADTDMYIGERGWQDWMEEYGDEENSEKIVEILKVIYSLQKMNLREMREANDMTIRAKFCEVYMLKLRTVEDWEAGKSPVPESTKMLVAYSFFAGRGGIERR